MSKFTQSLAGAKNIIELVGSETPWGESYNVLDVFERAPCVDYDFYFLSHRLEDNNFQSEQVQNIILKWHESDADIRVLDVCESFLSELGFDDQSHEVLNKAVFVAAALADVPNKLSYHNNLHFCKVVLHVARMISAHNFIFQDSDHALSKKDSAALLVAACIHDIGHDGSGNIVDRKYIKAKTELESYSYALPYLKVCDLGDDVLEELKLMLMCTDASPFGDPISPSSQLRRAYFYHFGEEDFVDLDLDDDFSVLEEDDILTLKCMLLHEADIMNSVGVSYDTTIYESLAVSDEIGVKATPEGTLLFFEKTCQNDLFTDSGRYLGQENFHRIRSRILDDYDKGNKVYSS